MIFTGANATLSITNPIWTALGANPGLRDEKPTVNHVSYDMACLQPMHSLEMVACTSNLFYGYVLLLYTNRKTVSHHIIMVIK
jgi:hypothetical protein